MAWRRVTDIDAMRYLAKCDHEEAQTRPHDRTYYYECRCCDALWFSGMLAPNGLRVMHKTLVEVAGVDPGSLFTGYDR